MSKPIINDFPELISDEVIARASKLSSTLLADGLKKLNVENVGCMAYDMQPVDDSMILVGTASTIDAYDGDNFSVHVATYGAKPGYVMVIAGKNVQKRSYIGELIVAAAQATGVKGIVVDGLVRDKLGIKELGLPLFARGYTPAGPGKSEMASINVPVVCADIKVEPGDLVFGDADGVCVVPRAKIEETLVIAEEKFAYEINRFQTINEYKKANAEGRELPQLAPQWVLDMLNDK